MKVIRDPKKLLTTLVFVLLCACGGNKQPANAPAANDSAKGTPSNEAAKSGTDTGKDYAWIAKLASDSEDERMQTLERFEKAVENDPRLFLGFMDSFADPKMLKAYEEKQFSETLGAAVELIKNQLTTTKDYIPDLIQRLDHKGRVVRAAAAFFLSECGELAAPALPKLAQLLNDEDEEVRGAALRAFERIGPNAKDYSKAIIAKLDDENEQVRHQARRVLETLELLPPLDKLGGMLTAEYKEQWNGEETIGWALQQIGSYGEKATSLVPKIRPLLKKKEIGILYTALECLEKIGEGASAAVPEIVELITKGDEQWQSFTTLAAMGQDGYAALRKLSKHEDESVRKGALRGMGASSVANKDTIAVLIAIVANTEGNYSEREGAAEGLAAAGLKAYPEVLDLFIPDDEGKFPYLAQEILERSGDEVWQYLTKNFAGYQPVVRAAVVRSVGFPNEEDKAKAGLVLVALSDKDAEVQTQAAEVARYFGTALKEAVPRLVELAKVDDDTLRANALEALADIDPDAKGVVDAAAASLHTHSSTLRAAALRTIERSTKGRLAHIEKIIAVLANDLNWEEESLAHQVLEGTGEDGLPFILKHLKSEDVKVRRGVAQVLRNMLQNSREAQKEYAADEPHSAREGQPSGELPIIKRDISGELIQALSDQDEDVRRNAGFALEAYGDKVVSPLLECYGKAEEPTKLAALKVLNEIVERSDKPDPQMEEILAKALESQNQAYVDVAVWGLRAFPKKGSELAHKLFESLVASERETALQLAFNVMAKHPKEYGESNVDLLIKGTKDLTWDVRNIALQQLRNIEYYDLRDLPKAARDRANKALEDSQKGD